MNAMGWQPYRERVIPVELKKVSVVDVNLPDCAICGRKIPPRKDEDGKDMRRDDGGTIFNGFVRIGAKKSFRICYSCKDK